MSKPNDELTNHIYDGIQEYNNPLPPWWVYLFIITIVWGAVYIIYYHIGGWGQNSKDEYTNEMKYIPAVTAGFSFEQNDFVPIKDANQINEGKDLFLKNCKPCHGEQGQGGVGPNLTDNYWLHGGKFEEIATSIANGYPEKGMPSWKLSLKKPDVLKLASFIMTLQGTNPPNPKKAEGEQFNP